MADMIRTTISLPQELHDDLANLAKERDISTPEIYRQAAMLLIDEDRRAKRFSDFDQLVRKYVDAVNSFPNPYQQVLADWRINRTGGQIDQILEARLELDAWSAQTYLMKLVSDLVEKFDQRDRFCTVTNLRFWKDAHADAFYLDSQKRAVRAGMSLVRIFLLDPLERGYWDEGLKVHREFLRGLNDAERKLVEVRYVALKEDAPAAAKFDHFALVQGRVGHGEAEGAGEDSFLLIEPAYDMSGSITRLRFLFSNQQRPKSHDLEIKVHVSRFQKLYDASQSIESLSPVEIGS